MWMHGQRKARGRGGLGEDWMTVRSAQCKVFICFNMFLYIASLYVFNWFYIVLYAFIWFYVLLRCFLSVV